MIELACGFAPNYTVFLILRALFGIGMGGEWGVGASLAMESAPPRWRGVLSGILQSGYSIGYLLAAIAARLVLPAWGWRPMFWIGALPAMLALYIRTKVPESAAWKEHRAESMAQVLKVVAALETFRVSRRVNDIHDVSVARNAGSVSRFPERSS